MDSRPSVYKTIALILMAIGMLSIAYYFAVVLPRQNAARLAFEQKKHDEEMKLQQDRLDEERKRRESDEEEKRAREINANVNESMLSFCLNEAADHKDDYVKHNGGTEAENGWMTAPQYVWDAADKRYKADKDDCYRQYSPR